MSTSAFRDQAAGRPPPLLLAAWLLALLFWPNVALARHPELAPELGAYRMIGAARYQVLTWSVFDAELWSARENFSWGEPFALSLTYRRAIPAETLILRALRGVAERTQLTAPEELASELRACFSDVRPGDRFTGVSHTADHARFYLNGRRMCDISRPGFRRNFFGIWLDARGRDRAFSARLIGDERAAARIDED